MALTLAAEIVEELHKTADKCARNGRAANVSGHFALASCELTYAFALRTLAVNAVHRVERRRQRGRK